MIEPLGIDINRPLARCRRAIDRCNGIIGKLLDFAGNGELHVTPVQLDAWLGGMLGQLTKPDEISLDQRFDAGCAIVSIDEGRLSRAIINVVENAVEALAESPESVDRRITISTHASDAAEIVITDHGRGMTEDVLSRIFEPLFSTRAFGAGLGLPTAKRIMDQHGGELTVLSAPGAGTSVVLRLPIVTPNRGQVAA